MFSESPHLHFEYFAVDVALPSYDMPTYDVALLVFPVSELPYSMHVAAFRAGTVDMRREGQGGGFKELDEQELEEARRRRKEYEDQDM